LPAIAEACGRSLAKHGVSIVNVGHTGLYHYARILQRESGVAYPIPSVCLTDRDIVPDVAADYVDKPAKGKRFESDYQPEEVLVAVQRKVDRAQGGATIVCVSDRWTLEFDLARYGCARLMHDAVALAVVASERGERLSQQDEQGAVATTQQAWDTLVAQQLAPDGRAARIYRPLYEKTASKAIAAQYAAHLLSTGHYGKGAALFGSLPPYLQRALNHLTSPPPASGGGAAVATNAAAPAS